MSRLSVEQVRGVMDQPLYWLAASYIPAYKSGRYTLQDLACGVAAALGRSAYDGEMVDEVTSILEGLGEDLADRTDQRLDHDERSKR